MTEEEKKDFVERFKRLKSVSAIVMSTGRSRRVVQKALEEAGVDWRDKRTSSERLKGIYF